jgi:plasmid stabilization system protein ParE
MSRGFIVRPLAEADLEDAARWYDGERASLAERFLSDVDRTFALIRERPFQFPQ